MVTTEEARGVPEGTEGYERGKARDDAFPKFCADEGLPGAALGIGESAARDREPDPKGNAIVVSPVGG